MCSVRVGAQCMFFACMVPCVRVCARCVRVWAWSYTWDVWRGCRAQCTFLHVWGMCVCVCCVRVGACKGVRVGAH